MNSLSFFRGWFALVVTILLWALFAYGFWSVEQQKNNYSTLVANADKEIQIVAQASRLHGLMSDTKNEREALHSIISADVIALVDIVDAAGKAAGIDIQISNVQPEAQKKGAPASAAVPVTFVVQTQGTYTQVTHVVELLNALPVPTSIQQVDFARSGSVWNLTARVRALTAPISS